LSEKEIVIAVDIGATKILIGAIDQSAKILGTRFFLTRTSRKYMDIVDDISENIYSLLKSLNILKEQLKGIVVGCPGVIDKNKEKIIIAPNLDWKNIELKSKIEERSGIKTVLENDVNLLTKGEAVFGAGKDAEVVLGIYIGTGIGGGIIIDGKIFSGFNGAAGEIGHVVIRKDGLICGCKKKGCWEAYSSTTAVYNILARKLKRLGIYDEEFIKMKDKTRAISYLYRNRIPELEDTFEEITENIGLGLSNLVNIFNPRKIVLGGGFINEMGDYLLPKIRYYTKKYSMEGTFEGAEIVKNILKGESIFYGALALLDEF